MSADIIPFSEAAPRARVRRAERELTGTDVLLLAAVCAWPVTWPLLFGASAIEAARAMWGRR